jgi:hypothetical protein
VEDEGDASEEDNSDEETGIKDIYSDNLDARIPEFIPPKNWANAPEFVPRSFGNLLLQL